MPIIPRYQRQVGATPLPVGAPGAKMPALPADAFGEGLAKGGAIAAKAGFAVLDEERKSADRSMVLGAKASMDGAEADLLYHPTNGAIAKRGSEAFGVDESTLTAFDEKTREISDGLGSDAQRETFKNLAAEKRVDLSRTLQRHIYGETTAYAVEQNKAALESTLNTVSLNYNDPQRVDRERRFGQAAILSDPAMKGYPPELRKLRVEKWNSIVVSTVVEKLMIDDPSAAKRYFDSNKDAVTAADQAHIEKALIPLAAQKRGFDFAVSVTRDHPEAAKDELLSLAQASLGEDMRAYGHAKEEIGSILEARDSAKRARIDRARAGVYAPVAEIVKAGRTPRWEDVPVEARVALYREDPGEAGRVQESLKKSARDEALSAVLAPVIAAERTGRVAKVSDIPAASLDALRKADPALTDQVLDELRNEGEHASDRIRTEADRPTEGQLTTWAQLKLDPQTLKSTNLDALLTHKSLTRSAYADLVTDQLALSKDKSGEKEGAILTTKEAVNDILTAAGWKEKSHPKEYALFWQELETRRKAFMAENAGKLPSQDQTKTMARELLSKLPTAAWGNLFGGKESFRTPPEALRVPGEERVKIEEALRRRGALVTDVTVSQMYRLNLERKGTQK